MREDSERRMKLLERYMVVAKIWTRVSLLDRLGTFIGWASSMMSQSPGHQFFHFSCLYSCTFCLVFAS